MRLDNNNPGQDHLHDNSFCERVLQLRCLSTDRRLLNSRPAGTCCFSKTGAASAERDETPWSVYDGPLPQTPVGRPDTLSSLYALSLLYFADLLLDACFGGGGRILRYREGDGEEDDVVPPQAAGALRARGCVHAFVYWLAYLLYAFWLYLLYVSLLLLR